MTLYQIIPIILLSFNCVALAYWISKLQERIFRLEQTLELRDWLGAISSGETLSDLAYMKEKGFLK